MNTPTSVSFDIVSDVHLDEHTPIEIFFPQKAPHLIIAGDLGDYDDFYDIVNFLNKACTSYKKVFYVMGNHEYYSKKGKNMESIDNHFEKLQEIFDNLYIFNSRHHYYIFEEQNLVIFGSTLWSHIPVEYLSYKLSYPITVKDNPLTPITWNYLFYAELYRLQQTIEEVKKNGQNLLVITHFSPLEHKLCIDLSRSAPVSNNVLYSTDLSKLFDSSMVGWVFGHTGYNTCESVLGVKVISNQYRVKKGRMYAPLTITCEEKSLIIS